MSGLSVSSLVILLTIIVFTFLSGQPNARMDFPLVSRALRAYAAVSDALRQMIESKGVGYHPNHVVTAVDPVQRRMTFANGASADFDLLAYIPPHRASQNPLAGWRCCCLHKAGCSARVG
jgi:hypothetical protein